MSNKEWKCTQGHSFTTIYIMLMNRLVQEYVSRASEKNQETLKLLISEAQLVDYRTTMQEDVGLNPGQTNTCSQGL